MCETKEMTNPEDVKMTVEEYQTAARKELRLHENRMEALQCLCRDVANLNLLIIEARLQYGLFCHVSMVDVAHEPDNTPITGVDLDIHWPKSAIGKSERKGGAFDQGNPF